MELPLILWALPFWLALCSHGISGCLDEERIALFEIKSAFRVAGGFPLWRMSSWGHGRDCCLWERVRCDPVTGRVTRLDLDGVRHLEANGTNWPRYVPYTLNATLFLPFKELRTVNLSHNYIQGLYANQGFERWSELGKLAFLDLSLNILPESVISSFAAISSLKGLSLHGNLMGGGLPIHGFRNWSRLGKLKYLDLSYNILSETIIPSLVNISSLRTLLLSDNHMIGRLPIQDLSRMRNLEVLDLEGNLFYGSIHPLLEEWNSLKVLILNGNLLNDTLTAQGFCKIRNLQKLDLSYNQLSGRFPSCIGNLTSLKYLDISGNELQLNFPLPLFANLTSLQFLSLSNNQFQGVFTFDLLSNHSELKTLELMDNDYNLEVESEHPMVRPSFQLECIILSKCKLNKNSGVVPNFLSSQYALKWIDIAHNSLKGNIPKWLLENKTSMVYLNLQNNSFTGPLVLPSHLNANASWFDISNNELTGELPRNLGILLPNLLYLNASRNNFHGRIPISFGLLRNLQLLDLSNNNLLGQITGDLVRNWSSLAALHLSSNMLHGQLLPDNSNLSSINSLLLDDNQFTGAIPISLCNCLSLSVLDVGENQLNGRLPDCMGNFSRLSVFNSEGNFFDGHIPSSFCNFQMLEFLDLSKNNLSGPIPPCLNLPDLQYLHLSENRLTGSFPNFLSNSTALTTLDIRNNYISGKLPISIGKAVTRLRVLLLKGNNFEGPIPKQFCGLEYLRILDLSDNGLSGDIPSCIQNMGSEDGSFLSSPYYTSFEHILPLENPNEVPSYFSGLDEVVFTIKTRYILYEGDILDYLSGVDLSCNQLVGDIPSGMGSMDWLITLNLSNNRLTGPIPHSFSNLKEIESLDLSHNMLTGLIPHQLVELYNLEVFSVAYNNLTGPTPGRDSQFITFGVSSYEGNPNLCGPPLEKSCNSTTLQMLPLPSPEGYGSNDKDDAVDHVIFFASFAISFVTGFWGFMAVLYLKTNWRDALFHTTDWYSMVIFKKICGILKR